MMVRIGQRRWLLTHRICQITALNMICFMEGVADLDQLQHSNMKSVQKLRTLIKKVSTVFYIIFIFSVPTTQSSFRPATTQKPPRPEFTPTTHSTQRTSTLSGRTHSFSNQNDGRN